MFEFLVTRCNLAAVDVQRETNYDAICTYLTVFWAQKCLIFLPKLLRKVKVISSYFEAFFRAKRK